VRGVRQRRAGRQGVKGTGSLAAKSFLNFGKDDTHSPQRGDIVVVKSSASPSGTHVGFLDSIDAKGNVRVLGGNTGDKVGTLAASAQRRAGDQAPADAIGIGRGRRQGRDRSRAVRQQALEAQGTFDSERQKLNQQYLQALGKVVAGYDAQATVQLMRAQGEHDAEAQQIATNLAEGKYGIATGQLAQTRAQQLQAANDSALKERQAAIALETYVKGLEARDAANERDTRFQLDGLQYQESIARTAAERRRLAQQIVDNRISGKRAPPAVSAGARQFAGENRRSGRRRRPSSRTCPPKRRARPTRPTAPTAARSRIICRRCRRPGPTSAKRSKKTASTRCRTSPTASRTRSSRASRWATCCTTRSRSC
jgi:hypothetical protein